MEIHLRKMQIKQVKPINGPVLMICPPSDAGLPLWENHLLVVFCTTRIAAHCVRDGGTAGGQLVVVGEINRLPFSREIFGYVMANCLFDFCSANETGSLLAEISRVLCEGGQFSAAHMTAANGLLNRLWNTVFSKLQFLSGGCHPVDLTFQLNLFDLRQYENRFMTRAGFPIQFLRAKKTIPARDKKG